MVVNHTGNAARINKTWHYQKSSPLHSGRITWCNRDGYRAYDYGVETKFPKRPALHATG